MSNSRLHTQLGGLEFSPGGKVQRQKGLILRDSPDQHRDNWEAEHFTRGSEKDRLAIRGLRSLKLERMFWKTC